MDARLINAVKQWRERYPDQISSWRRLHGWLLDHAPSERRIAKALSAVARLELFRHLEPLAGKQLDPFTFRRLVDALTAEEGLSADLSEAAVLIWAEAMGVEPPDAAALRGPLDRHVVAASLDATRALHLSLVSSDLRPISQVRVESTSTRPLADLSVAVWLSIGLIHAPSLFSPRNAQMPIDAHGILGQFLDRLRVRSQARHF